MKLWRKPVSVNERRSIVNCFFRLLRTSIAWRYYGVLNRLTKYLANDLKFGAAQLPHHLAKKCCRCLHATNRKAARKAAREADRAEAEAWSIRMEGYGGPAQPSPTIGQCLNGGLGWLEVECNRCKTQASLPLADIRRPRDTPIWKLEAALKTAMAPRKTNSKPAKAVAAAAISPPTSITPAIPPPIVR
jgi:hypothetical protein